MPRRKRLAVDLPHLPEAVDFLRQGDDFVLTSHVNCDGDGIGGSLALQGLLRSLGKRASIVFDEGPDDAYAFLEGWGQIQAFDASLAAVRHLVVLDCPNLERIGRLQQALDTSVRILNLDHHRDNGRYGHVNLVTEEVSSTCELVYHLATALGLRLDAARAEALYAGILFDTGGFRYSLATATTFEVASDLVRRGARLDLVADRIFSHKSLAAVKQLGKGIDSLALHFDGRVALLHLDYEDMRAGDPEEVVNYGLLVDGVEVALLLREQEPGRYRVSLRAREQVDVARVASAFGGGGHARAAGCRLQGSLETVAQSLLGELSKHLAPAEEPTA